MGRQRRVEREIGRVERDNSGWSAKMGVWSAPAAMLIAPAASRPQPIEEVQVLGQAPGRTPQPAPPVPISSLKQNGTLLRAVLGWVGVGSPGVRLTFCVDSGARVVSCSDTRKPTLSQGGARRENRGGGAADAYRKQRWRCGAQVRPTTASDGLIAEPRWPSYRAPSNPAACLSWRRPLGAL